MSWSDERVEKLKKMWAEGQSASQIAKELGGVTRNAVIGKVHRLGLSNRNGAGSGATAAAPESGVERPSSITCSAWAIGAVANEAARMATPVDAMF